MRQGGRDRTAIRNWDSSCVDQYRVAKKNIRSGMMVKKLFHCMERVGYILLIAVEVSAELAPRAAQAAIHASAIGGPAVVPAELRAIALQRRMAFDSMGTQQA